MIPCEPYTYEDYVKAWGTVSAEFIDAMPFLPESDFDEMIAEDGYNKIVSIAVDLDDLDEEEVLSNYPEGSKLVI